MPSLSGHHHVALTVTDLDRSIEWYQRVLGLTVLFREEGEEGEERRACVMGFPTGGFAVGLVEHAANDGSAFDHAHTGLDHHALTVATREELDVWAASLNAEGVEHSGAIDVPPGAILNLRDPDGIALALFWDRPA